jgi:flagellar basal-body rod protein FlgC
MRLGSIASSALNAFGVDMMVRANNIANVNTPGFKAQDVTLMTGPRDEGVMVGSVYRDNTPGSPRPWAAIAYESGDGALPADRLETSNTDLVREFTGLIATQRAFEANAAVIRTYDAVSGTVLDSIV